jgi:hypothetical protein
VVTTGRLGVDGKSISAHVLPNCSLTAIMNGTINFVFSVISGWSNAIVSITDSCYVRAPPTATGHGAHVSFTSWLIDVAGISLWKQRSGLNDLRFSRRLVSSAILRCALPYKLTDVSEVLSASILWNYLSISTRLHEARSQKTVIFNVRDLYFLDSWYNILNRGHPIPYTTIFGCP